jgi:molecular chaperone DnaK
MGDKMSAASKSRLEAEIKKVEDAIATNNTSTIKSATEALNKVWSEVASEMYAQAGAAGQPPHEAPNAGPQQASDQTKKDEKEVQDASYEVVDDENEKNKKKQ